jgi:phage regulator Rha-like protein
VETKRLVEQVKRNIERFPADFMFQLDETEMAALRSQIATSKTGRGGRRYAPYVFTEQGVAMLSGVLRSKRAVAVNIEIMRAFVELRRAAASYSALEDRLKELERETTARFGRHDEQLDQIFKTLRQLISPPARPKRPVGFRPPDDDRVEAPPCSALIRSTQVRSWPVAAPQPPTPGRRSSWFPTTGASPIRRRLASSTPTCHLTWIPPPIRSATSSPAIDAAS